MFFYNRALLFVYTVFLLTKDRRIIFNIFVTFFLQNETASAGKFINSSSLQQNGTILKSVFIFCGNDGNLYQHQTARLRGVKYTD